MVWGHCPQKPKVLNLPPRNQRRQMSRMFPKSPSLGDLTHRAWTEERAGPRSWDWGTRCQQRRSGSLGHRPSTVPGGQQPHARAFLRKATPAAEPPSPRRACAAAAGPTQRLSASLLSPLPGDTAAARRARSEGGGESGQEQRGPRRPRTTWGWFAAAGRSGPTWARAEAAHTCGRHTRPIAKCRPQKEHAPLRVRGHCAQTRSLSPDGRKDRGSR